MGICCVGVRVFDFQVVVNDINILILIRRGDGGSDLFGYLVNQESNKGQRIMNLEK